MKAPIVALVVIGGLVVGGYFVDRSREQTRSVLSGTFETQPSRLAPKIAGRVSAILCREGDAVRKGQVLIRLSARDTAFQAEASEALANQAKAREAEVRAGTRPEEILRQRAAVAEATAVLSKLEHGAIPEEIRSAQEKVREAQARLKELRNGARPQEIASARAAVRQAYDRWLAVRRGPTVEERRQLTARLESAEANLGLARKDYDRKKTLADQGALAVAVADQARAQRATAQATRDEAAEALRRARLGGPEEEVGQAYAAYKQAQAQLNLVTAGPRREEIDAAQAAVGAAVANLDLVRRGACREDVQAAKARLVQAQSTFAEMVRGNRSEQIEQAQAATEAARGQAGASRSLLGETAIVAPMDGVVERVLVADGDLLTAGMPAVQIANANDLWLRVYLPEEVLSKVKVGDRALLAIDGIPNPVAAVVESIATQGEFTPANLQTPEERGRQVFAIRLRLAKADPRVKAGMSATVKELGRWP